MRPGGTSGSCLVQASCSEPSAGVLRAGLVLGISQARGHHSCSGQSVPAFSYKLHVVVFLLLLKWSFLYFHLCLFPHVLPPGSLVPFPASIKHSHTLLKSPWAFSAPGQASPSSLSISSCVGYSNPLWPFAGIAAGHPCLQSWGAPHRAQHWACPTRAEQRPAGGSAARCASLMGCGDYGVCFHCFIFHNLVSCPTLGLSSAVQSRIGAYKGYNRGIHFWSAPLSVECTSVKHHSRANTCLSSVTCHSSEAWRGKKKTRFSYLFHIGFVCIFFVGAVGSWHQFGRKELQLGRPRGRLHIISPEHSHYWRVVSWGV